MPQIRIFFILIGSARECPKKEVGDNAGSPREESIAYKLDLGVLSLVLCSLPFGHASFQQIKEAVNTTLLVFFFSMRSLFRLIVPHIGQLYMQHVT